MSHTKPEFRKTATIVQEFSVESGDAVLLVLPNKSRVRTKYVVTIALKERLLSNGMMAHQRQLDAIEDIIELGHAYGQVTACTFWKRIQPTARWWTVRRYYDRLIRKMADMGICFKRRLPGIRITDSLEVVKRKWAEYHATHR